MASLACACHGASSSPAPPLSRLPRPRGMIPCLSPSPSPSFLSFSSLSPSRSPSLLSYSRRAPLLPGHPSEARKTQGRVAASPRLAARPLASSSSQTGGSDEQGKGASVENDGFPLSKRALMVSLGGLSVSSIFQFGPFHAYDASAEEAPSKSNFTDMPALRGKDYGKTKMRYEDYVLTESGLQYKDLREGSGKNPERGQTVVIDWDGFTIGYYGRIFEARNKAKGGSFEGNEKDFYRFQVGANKVIPAFEEAIATMQVGGVRRIIVPPEIGYPDNDFNKLGPRPTTFSGQRALDFVLKNQGLIDKTLLFDIELLRIVD